MKVKLEKNRCIVTREPGDRLPRNGGWGTAESGFWHQVKVALRGQGYDVIKRRMQDDGHLYGDETLPYIRERKHAFYVYDGDWAVRDIVAQYKEDGWVELLVQRNKGKTGSTHEDDMSTSKATALDFEHSLNRCADLVYRASIHGYTEAVCDGERASSLARNLQFAIYAFSAGARSKGVSRQQLYEQGWARLAAAATTAAVADAWRCLVGVADAWG